MTRSTPYRRLGDDKNEYMEKVMEYLKKNPDVALSDVAKVFPRFSAGYIRGEARKRGIECAALRKRKKEDTDV